jgi:hypothetical protein
VYRSSYGSSGKRILIPLMLDVALPQPIARTALRPTIGAVIGGYAIALSLVIGLALATGRLLAW